MTRLEISLLGEFEVRRDGERVSLGSRRTEALFGYLVMSPSPQGREHLVDLLWQERQSATAPGNLRVLFTNLRKSVGDVVQIDRSSARFLPDAAEFCTVDVHEHQQRSAAPLRRPPELLRQDELQDLRRSLEVCRGDFLAHLELPELTRFDEWARAERDRLRRHRCAVLGHLCRAELAQDDVPDSLRHARQLLDLEPLAESAHQHVLRALVAAGDMDGAVAQFEHLEQVLHREFGTSPTGHTRSLLVRRPPGLGGSPAPLPETVSPSTVLPETVLPRTASRLRVRDAQPTPWPTGPVSEGQPAVRAPWATFVDRERETELLHRAGAETVRGVGGTVLVRGSAGSGKSVLVRRVVRMLLEQQPGLVALGGSCAGVVAPPWQDVLLGTLHEQLSGRADGPWLEGRMPVLVADRIGTLRGEPSAPVANDPFALAALAASLRSLAHRRPVLLVVENLQWATPATLSLLSSLALDVRGRALQLVCTLRPRAGGRPGPAGFEDSPAVDWLVTRLQRSGRTRVIELDRGDEREQRAFVTALIDSERHGLPGSLATDVASLGAGNPLMTVELLRDLHRRGSVVQREGRFVLAGDPVWPTVPDRIALSLDETLVGIPPGATAMLEVAAHLGVEFGTDELVAQTGADPWTVRVTVTEQLARHLQILVPTDAGQFRFRHPLLRDHLLARAHVPGRWTAAVRQPLPVPAPGQG
ncbi:MAG TPA: AAA family ATPase [Marmoricola sp.]|nr:AAA family ATPase [Marmoricola sp.]